MKRVIKQYASNGTIMQILVILWFLSVGYFFVLKLFPYRWIEYYNDPFPVKNKVVRAGEVLEYTVDYCRFNDHQAAFSKDIISTNGGVAISLASYTSSFGINCKWYTGNKGHSEVLIRSTVIPSNLPPGEYFMKMTVEQRANPVRILTFSVETEPFTVIE